MTLVAANDVFQQSRFRNGLLDALKQPDAELLGSVAERVSLARGHVLFEPGDSVTVVHFPCGPTIAALIVTMENGDAVETATIGREGAIGGIVSQGHLPAFARGVVQVAGPAIRIETARLQDLKSRSVAVRNLFARYADCLLAQILQSVACNALHPMEGRCARWLLSLHDRIGADDLPVTQQTLAEMLGVQRTYLSRVLGALSRRGLVRAGRGTIQVLSREGLERASCECYAAVRLHYEGVLGGIYPTIPAEAEAEAGR
ncbi:Crp/Fnr family transcriptional regulator [Mongoliimonas terrestris]|uniref:Crp/Fnr family transcriptional regulator n=1 Tax=Mongoliimonas terrestris TaxID=1709001 RepID=UPI000949730D|nr:Crp/Fnr family transcriptional regulator [Mongoliimonas terrestris]